MEFFTDDDDDDEYFRLCRLAETQEHIIESKELICHGTEPKKQQKEFNALYMALKGRNLRKK